MSLPRLWRTIRHLSAEQWLYRAICRGKRVAMREFPGLSRSRVERIAAGLPLPDPGAPSLAAVARPVLALQAAVHGVYLDGIAQGRFVLLNQSFDFGRIDAIDWRGDFQEGNNPLRRMTLAYMGYAVPLLARGRPDDLTVIQTLLEGLEQQNPWSAPGVFRDVWNPYTASHRLINLLSGLALYRASDMIPDQQIEADILAHVRFCAAFIRSNLERDLQYNHLLKNMVALTAYAAGLSDFPRELEFLPAALSRSLRQNILADGGHAERCPMYHVLSLLDVDVICASGVFSGTTAQGLKDFRERMAAALRSMSHPDGDIALFNDSWLGEAPPAGDLTDLAAAADIERLPETGYVRIGRGDDAVIFDCGPCGPDDNPGHAHADFLSLEASVGGKRLIVDSGVPTYTAGEARDYSRSAKAHNGPHLRGAEPIEFWKSFRVGRRGRAIELTNPTLSGVAPLWCAGKQDGYAPAGVEARRYIGLWPGAAILVCDAWIGSSRQRAGTDLLIPDSWSPEENDDVTFVQGTTRVGVPVHAGRLDGVLPDRVWPRFGVEQKAHRIAVTPESYGNYRAAVIWLSWSDDAEVPDASALASLLGRLVGC
jgi:hypothetical protein